MEQDLRVTEPHDHAAGVLGVAVSMRRSLHHMGSIRAARTLRALNQTEGFDCMSCAWPDLEPGHRHTADSARAAPRPSPRKRPRPGLLRRSSPLTACGPGCPVVVVAGAAGPDYPPHDHQTGRHSLSANRMGRRPGSDWPRAQRTDQSRPGHLLYIRAHVQRGRLRLSALRARGSARRPTSWIDYKLSSASTRRGRTASTPSRRSGRYVMAEPASSSASAETSCRPRPTPTSRPRPYATPG